MRQQHTVLWSWPVRNQTQTIIAVMKRATMLNVGVASVVGGDIALVHGSCQLQRHPAHALLALHLHVHLHLHAPHILMLPL